MSTSTASRMTGQSDVLSWVRAILAIAFVLSLPLLIVSTNLRAMVTDRDFLLAGFRDNDVGAVTGLDDRQLQRVADAFVAYFQAPPGRMDVQVTINGQQRPLFNEREIEHMQDVQALIQLFLRLQVIAAGVVLVRLAFMVAVDRSPRGLGLEMLWSSALIVLLVVLVGALSFVDFTDLWTRFHQVAFRNDLWLLDPRTDYLIMLFPEPFWYTGTLRMAAGTALMTAGVALVGFLVWRFGPPER